MTKLSLNVKIIYAFGNLGIGILTVLHLLYLVYFFIPPEDVGIPYLIPQTNFILGLSLLGVIIFVGKIIDAFFDPIIASISSRYKHDLGKRIPLMRYAALPFALCFVLVFFVPTDGVSFNNVIWLTCFIVLSALFYTLYMIPFYSLLVDLAKSSDDKVDLGTASGAFWFVGFVVVSFAPSVWSFFIEHLAYTPLLSMQITFSIFATLGFFCLMIPAFCIDGRLYSSSEANETTKIIASLKIVLKNRSFKYYLLSNTCYTVATILFESGLIYFITVLALLEAKIQGPIVTLIACLTLACYPIINKLAKIKGKSYVLKISLILFGLTFIVISCLGLKNLNIYLLLVCIVLLSPFAQASFGILPHVITADCAEYEKHKTKQECTAMYIAANSFCIKIGFAFGFLLFTSFLLLGKNVGDDLGIRLATVCGVILSLIGFLLLTQYDEKEILSYAQVNASEIEN